MQRLTFHKGGEPKRVRHEIRRVCCFRERVNALLQFCKGGELGTYLNALGHLVCEVNSRGSNPTVCLPFPGNPQRRIKRRQACSLCGQDSVPARSVKISSFGCSDGSRGERPKTMGPRPTILHILTKRGRRHRRNRG